MEEQPRSFPPGHIFTPFLTNAGSPAGMTQVMLNKHKDQADIQTEWNVSLLADKSYIILQVDLLESFSLDYGKGRK